MKRGTMTAHTGLRTALRKSAGTALALACLALPGLAQANSAAAEYFMGRSARSAVPKLLSEDERSWYKDAFATLKRQDWATLRQMLATRPDGPLHTVLRAEYYLAPGSPRIELDALNQWLASGTTLPEAEQIESLAAKRGGAALPALPSAQQLVAWPSAPRRTRPRSVSDNTMPLSVANSINDRIKINDTAGAKQLLDGVDATLSSEARAEWRDKIAWAYYINNQDNEAYAQAIAAAQDPNATTSGAWVGEAWWTAGLAAWRQGACQQAVPAFAEAAKSGGNQELIAAAYYWESRAFVRCRQPEQAAAALRSAARADETLYGMLAAEQLGLKMPGTHALPDFTANDWQNLRDTPNVRVAVGLAEVGEDGLADDVLRYQARIGAPGQYQQLSRLARDLGLPGTQLWMAYNAPSNSSPTPASRYPTPKWTPATGWKVDPALLFAHTLQESAFRTNVVSGAGARGLMQIMPAAARDHAAVLGVSGSVTDLTRPEVNLAFGQEHLEALKSNAATQGLLPKVIAAYNAGPLPVARWNTQIRDNGDPLLWMESVPYWETRGYVATVLRNYWMYERQAGVGSESRVVMAQGMWPTFPELSGSKGIRMAAKDWPTTTTTTQVADRN